MRMLCDEIDKYQTKGKSSLSLSGQLSTSSKVFQIYSPSQTALRKCVTNDVLLTHTRGLLDHVADAIEGRLLHAWLLVPPGRHTVCPGDSL